VPHTGTRTNTHRIHIMYICVLTTFDVVFIPIPYVFLFIWQPPGHGAPRSLRRSRAGAELSSRAEDQQRAQRRGTVEARWTSVHAGAAAGCVADAAPRRAVLLLARHWGERRTTTQDRHADRQTGRRGTPHTNQRTNLKQEQRTRALTLDSLCLSCPSATRQWLLLPLSNDGHSRLHSRTQQHCT
jgi:hypothetical protein